MKLSTTYILINICTLTGDTVSTGGFKTVEDAISEHMQYIGIHVDIYGFDLLAAEHNSKILRSFKVVERTQYLTLKGFRYTRELVYDRDSQESYYADDFDVQNDIPKNNEHMN